MAAQDEIDDAAELLGSLAVLTDAEQGYSEQERLAWLRGLDRGRLWAASQALYVLAAKRRRRGGR